MNNFYNICYYITLLQDIYFNIENEKKIILEEMIKDLIKKFIIINISIEEIKNKNLNFKILKAIKILKEIENYYYLKNHENNLIKLLK